MYISIELGGEKRDLTFNMFALEEYTRRMLKIIDAAIKANPSMPIDEIKPSQSALVYACIYSGLIGQAFRKDVEFAHSFADVCDWVEGAKADDLELACNCLAETERYKEKLKNLEGLVTNLTTDVTKKKVSRKPTKKSGS